MNVAWTSTALAVMTGMVISYWVGMMVPGDTKTGRGIGAAITMCILGFPMCWFFTFSIWWLIDGCSAMGLCASNEELGEMYYRFPYYCIPVFMIVAAYRAASDRGGSWWPDGFFDIFDVLDCSD